MSDSFVPLSSCGDTLPSASAVDSVSFHQFVTLKIPQDGKLHDAVYPPDYAVPDLMKEIAVAGWPPHDLVASRRGLPLLPEWEEPSEWCATGPKVDVEVDDLDGFLADPRVTVSGRKLKLPLTPLHLKALVNEGRTVVRFEDRPPVEVKLGERGGVDATGIGHEIEVEDLGELLTGMSALGELQLSAANVRELRETGATWIQRRKAGGRDGGGQVRVALRSMAPASVGAPVEAAAVPPATAMTSSALTVAYGSGPYDLAQAIEPKYTQIALTEFVPNVRFAIYLPYRQEWALVGFARGDLLNTIPLAPGEETTIEIFSWDRQRFESALTEETGWETSLEVQATDRLTRDITHELTKNEAWKLTSAGVQVGYEAVNVSANLAGDFGTVVNDLTKDTINHMQEATVKAASKARGLRQTKVTESREWGTEQRTTRRLRNPNLCQGLSYDVFEVLAKYEVTTKLVPEQARLAMLVPNPLPISFNRQTVTAWEGVLQRTLLDPRQAVGFDAARWLAAREEHDLLLCAQRPACAQPSTTKTSTAPPTTTTTQPTDKVTPARNRAIAAGDQVAAAVKKIRTATHRVASAYDAGVRGAALEEVILEYRQWLFRVFGLEKFQPGFWGACLRFESEWPSNRTPERLEQLLNEISSSWLEAVGRVALGVLLAQIAIPVIAVELVLHLGLKTLWYAQYTVRGFDDAGLGARLTTARTEVEAWRAALTGGPAAAPTPPADVPSAPPPPPGQDDFGSTRAFPDEEAAKHRISERGLLTHLEHNRSHYMEAIWRSLAPVDRARILSGAFGNAGDDAEPEVLGFLGDDIAVPFRTTRYPQLRQRLDAAVDALEPEPDGNSVEVVLITPGIAMQTRLDDCDACEPFVDEQRQLELARGKAVVDRSVALARAAELEVDRLQARLDADLLEASPAELPTISVRLDNADDEPDE